MDDCEKIIDSALKAKRQEGEKERARKAKMWEDDPHEWLAFVASGTKGAAGKAAVRALCKAENIPLRAYRRGIIANDCPVVVKCSVADLSGNYVFENIRREFRILFCLGISPGGIKHAWLLTQEEHSQHLQTQHKGTQTDKGDMWIHIDPAAPEEWLSQGPPAQSGRVADAINLLMEKIKA